MRQFTTIINSYNNDHHHVWNITFVYLLFPLIKPDGVIDIQTHVTSCCYAWGADCSIVVKVLHLICMIRSAKPLSKALNPTLLQGKMSPA